MEGCREERNEGGMKKIEEEEGRHIVHEGET